MLGFAIVIALLFAQQFIAANDHVHRSSQAYFISNVNLVDVELGVVVAGQDVELRDHTITSISAHQSLPAPQDAHMIDGTGKFLLPGLWDMHTHSWKTSPELHHPLFIAYGVTTVRDLSGCLSHDDPFWACPADRDQWNTALQNGTSLSPRYIEQSSYQTNGGSEVPSDFDDFFRLKDQSAAFALVAFYQSQGVTSIKPYSELSQDQYSNLVQAAKAQGLKVAGHRPLAVSLDTLLSLQQDSVEHGRLFLFACHRQAQEFMSQTDPVAAYTSDFIRSMIVERNHEECDALMQRMSLSNT